MTGHSPERDTPCPNPPLMQLLGDEFYFPPTDEMYSLAGLMTQAHEIGDIGNPEADEREDAKFFLPGLAVVRVDSPLVPGVFVSAYTGTKQDGQAFYGGVQIEAAAEQTLRVMGNDKLCMVKSYRSDGSEQIQFRAPWGVVRNAGVAETLAFDAGSILQMTHHRTHGG